MKLLKKLNILTYTLTIIFFSSFELVFSQEIIDDTNFESIDADITQRAITTIFNDNEGYLWIGTYGDGLFRYNSVDFKNYKQKLNFKENSLNSSIIFSALQDKQHKIWIGTQYGINLYNRDLDRFESIDLLKDGKVENFEIHAITEYNEDVLLLGTYHNGLYKFDKKDFTHELIPYYDKKPVSDLLINTIVKLSNGRVLIGTNDGLMTFDPYSEVLQLAKFDTENGGYESIDISIESMLVAKDNSIWIGTFSSGLIRLFEDDKGIYTIEKYPISEKRILSLAEKTEGSILCGTENDGLFEINTTSGNIKSYRYNKLKQNDIKSNSIWTVYTDIENRVWLGYYNSGIDVYDPNNNKFNSLKSIPYFPNSLNTNSVTGIVSDEKGRLWISMLDGGVDVYNPNDGTFVNLFDQNNSIAKGLNCLDVQTIFIDSHKNIWVGTWDSGLYILKHNKKKFINVNSTTPNSIFKTNRIMSFGEDSKGTIWIGTFLNGLYSYNPLKKTFIHHNSLEFQKHNINTSNIRKVLVDHQDNIWIGSRSGLFKIENSKNSVFRVSSLNKKMNLGLGKSETPRIVVSLYEDSENQLWIGTLGNGLYRYNTKNDAIRWYNVNNDLIHETVSSIVQDNAGNVWLGGNAGLSKFNIEKNVFTNFNKKDGLLSNSFNYNSVYKSSGNVLYFGSSKGINYFNPDKIIYNRKKPSVYLTNLRVSNELVHPNSTDSPLKKVISKTKEIILNHNQSSFTIEYVGVNYTRSKNNQYAYYLEGFDEEWNYVGANKSANYKHIPYGKYVFMVKASNNDGVWNDIPTKISIEILPAWWATKLAIFGYILVSLLLFYLIYRFVSVRIQEKRVLNLERQQYKQFEALNAKKIQFFTNISHEFRTPLTLILTPLEDLINKESSKLSNEINEKHHIIFKNAKRLSRLINELMDFRKLQFNKMSINASQINIVPFIEEVVSHFEEEALLKNISLSVEYEDNNFVLWSDPSMLEKIVFNLLSNAFKATPNGGLITIQINKPIDLILLPLVNENKPVAAIEIIIKDTGLGIKEGNLDKVFDRFYQANEMNEQYYGGTGIGLELVKSFIDLHKGKIVLTSKEKVGTQFKIYLPLGYSHLKGNITTKKQKNVIHQYSETQNENWSEVANDKESTNKKMLLIVEDNLELRTYLKNELKGEYTIKEAENGLEGLEKATKFIPDVIITDVMMPIMDGFEFCERIKNDLKTSHIPLLMVTAKGMQMDRVKGLDSGADVYLNKPFNMSVLRSHLKQLITSRQILFDKYFKGINTDISSDNTTSLDKQFITNVLTYINDNISDEKLNVENLAGELLLSRSKLYRKIKALTGGTANEFIRKIRLEKAKELLENSEHTISEICFKVGYSSPSYFTKCFKDQFNMLPTEIRVEKEGNTTEL